LLWETAIQILTVIVVVWIFQKLLVKLCNFPSLSGNIPFKKAKPKG